jgi:hypothetical protein
VAVDGPVVQLDLSRLIGFRDVAAAMGDNATLIRAMDSLHAKIGEGEGPIVSPGHGELRDRH